MMKLPKIELHCHLDGSLRPESVADIAKIENIDLGIEGIENIRHAMAAPNECTSLDEYLERFKLPLMVMQSKYAIKRVVYELLEDAANENVKYIEIRFAPIFHIIKGLSLEEVIESAVSGLEEGEDKFDIKGNLILSCMRHLGEKEAFETVEAGKKFLGKGVVAIDVAGSEGPGFAKAFEKPIALAKKYGYRVTIHAGETGIGRNVIEAIEILGAERIGHGVYITDCKESYDAVKEKGIVLEMCPTSNVQTKAVKEYKDHPFADFHRKGIKVTVNTDNRTVSQVNMTRECEVLFDEFKVNNEEYKKVYLDSIDASFCDNETKVWLKRFI